MNRGSIAIGALCIGGLLFLTTLYLSMPWLVRGTVLARHQDRVENELDDYGITVVARSLNYTQIHGSNTTSVDISALFGDTDEYAECELTAAIHWFVNVCLDQSIQEVYQGEGVSLQGFGLVYVYDGGGIYWWFETDTTRFVLLLFIELS